MDDYYTATHTDLPAIHASVTPSTPLATPPNKENGDYDASESVRIERTVEIARE